jgi:hypothetical protein
MGGQKIFCLRIAGYSMEQQEYNDAMDRVLYPQSKTFPITFQSTTSLIFFSAMHFHFGLPDKLSVSYANLQMPAQGTRVFSRKLHGGLN